MNNADNAPPAAPPGTDQRAPASKRRTPRSRTRKAAGSLFLAAALVGGWLGGETLLNRVQFARAEQQVDATRQQLQTAGDVSSVFRAVNKAVEQSVVSIEVKKVIKGARRGRLPLDDEFLRRFFPDRDGDGKPDVPDGTDPQQIPNGGGDNGADDGGPGLTEQGEGSGVIMDAGNGEAFILTNNHVAGGATEMVVTLSDGTRFEKATLVGADPKSDLAVVKIPSDKVIPAKWGNSDELEKGDYICAFGSPFGYVGSMTHGIVSALNRQARIISGQFAYENFIQVDAPINPGNSGGPLVNLKGQVVGINTAIATRSGGFQGIGFAVPSNQAKVVYQQLREHGKVTRGWLGVAIGNVADNKDAAHSTGYKDDTGVLVSGTMKNTPASGKLEPADVITALNGKPVKDADALRMEIARIAPNTEVKLTVSRAGKETEVTIKLGEQPDDLLASNAAPERGGRRNGRGGEAPEASTLSGLGLRLVTPTEQQVKRFGLTDEKGAMILQVTPGSPAEKAGLAAGEVIVKVDDIEVADATKATEALTKIDAAAGIRLLVADREGTHFAFIKPRK